MNGVCGGRGGEGVRGKWGGIEVGSVWEVGGLKGGARVREVAVTVPLARGLEIRGFFFSFLLFLDLKFNHLLSILSPTLCFYRPILTISTTLLPSPAISNDTG